MEWKTDGLRKHRVVFNVRFSGIRRFVNAITRNCNKTIIFRKRENGGRTPAFKRVYIVFNEMVPYTRCRSR